MSDCSQPPACETRTPAPLVGGFVRGSFAGKRIVVQAEALYRAYHENDLPDGFDNGEAYASLFQYPQGDYAPYVLKAGSPKGYIGPTACTRLLWDIDSGDQEAALADLRKLIRYLRDRYGDYAERSMGIYYSGKKGFHLTLPAPPHVPRPQVPGVVKRLCLAVARAAGVTVDAAVYDHQRIMRLPNTRHPGSGLYKRCFDPDEFDRLDLTRIRKAAEAPAGFAVPEAAGGCPRLAEDWAAAEVVPVVGRGKPGGGGTRAAGAAKEGEAPSYPAVPQYVRDFIGFGDLNDPSRAITIMKVAASLSEAVMLHGVPALISGLLEESALATGLGIAEVRRQIECGIERGARPRPE